MTTSDADTRTRGQRWADAVTRFGGSWAFICTFVGSSAVWVLWNSLAAGRPDPYPFLFLNMLLTVISTLCFYLRIDRMKRIDSATKRTAHSLDCYISA